MDKVRVSALGDRLDVELSRGGQVSRARAQALIKEGRARVNGRTVEKPSHKTDAGDEILLDVPAAAPAAAEPENISLNILYEDSDLAVVVKPAGMVVHPACGNESGTLVNALLYHLKDLSGIGGTARPGIVHRLDKDTSGLLLVAKNDRAHLDLSAQLQRRAMEKHYAAVVAGRMKEESGVIEAPIGRSPKDRKKMAVVEGGRDAETRWRVLSEQADRTLLDVRIITGRTHQIRVHMASVHHPVLGDPLYGTRGMPSAPRLMLHAMSLSFTHPSTGERMTFFCPPERLFGLPEGMLPEKGL